MTGQILGETWLLSAFFLLSYTGFIEEVMFRGAIHTAAVRMFGWVVRKTGSLLVVVLAHGIANTVLFLLMLLIL